MIGHSSFWFRGFLPRPSALQISSGVATLLVGVQTMPFDAKPSAPVDQFGRQVTYLRLSVTDRCDLRCRYCMPQKMTFLPRKDVLDLEELATLAETFIKHGVTKIRLTGGEPLVRPGIMSLISRLSKHLSTHGAQSSKTGRLEELTLTTNGTMLADYAKKLAHCGVKRVNVSLDTLDADRYRHITRFGDIRRVLSGIDAALDAGLQVKINALASKGTFESELDDLIRFSHGRGMDLTLIEEMPLGDTPHSKDACFLSLADLRQQLEQRWTVSDSPANTGGPARYINLRETGGRIGLITPMSCSFCDACNRARLSCTGKLYTCMGHQGSSDLRPVLQADAETAYELLQQAIWKKPRSHDFLELKQSDQTLGRPMSVLGG